MVWLCAAPMERLRIQPGPCVLILSSLLPCLQPSEAERGHSEPGRGPQSCTDLVSSFPGPSRVLFLAADLICRCPPSLPAAFGSRGEHSEPRRGPQSGAASCRGAPQARAHHRWQPWQGTSQEVCRRWAQDHSRRLGDVKEHMMSDCAKCGISSA